MTVSKINLFEIMKTAKISEIGKQRNERKVKENTTIGMVNELAARSMHNVSTLQKCYELLPMKRNTETNWTDTKKTTLEL